VSDRLDIRRTDVVIVGAGILGASLAYFLARAGVRPLVLERAGPAAEASGANAGMIGPSGGIPGKTLALSLLSAELYDQASHELDAPIDFQRGGRLLLAHSASDVAERETFVRERQGLGISLEMLYGPDIREIEPILSEKVIAAAYAPDDGQIDPFRATTAYLSTACRLGARLEVGVAVESLVVEGGAVRGVIANGQRIGRARSARRRGVVRRDRGHGRGHAPGRARPRADARNRAGTYPHTASAARGRNRHTPDSGGTSGHWQRGRVRRL